VKTGTQNILPIFWTFQPTLHRYISRLRNIRRTFEEILSHNPEGDSPNAYSLIRGTAICPGVAEEVFFSHLPTVVPGKLR
jgi:hypothetical protein